MATIEFKGYDEYAKKITKLGRAGAGIIRYSVYDAAGMVIEAIKANTPLSKDKHGQTIGGDLRDSAILTNFVNDKGYIYTSVQFVGYDRYGQPNAIAARVLESGSSTRNKHPFIGPAVRKVRAAAEAKIGANLNKKINEIMK